MMKVTEVARLTDRVWMCCAKVEECLKCFRFQMRLVSQADHPVSQGFLPTRPLRGAPDGAEHSRFRLRIRNLAPGRDAEPLQLCGERGIVFPKNHGNLMHAQLLPETDLMAEDRRSGPGQKQLWLPHASGASGTQQCNSVVRVCGHEIPVCVIERRHRVHRGFGIGTGQGCCARRGVWGMTRIKAAGSKARQQRGVPGMFDWSEPNGPVLG